MKAFNFFGMLFAALALSFTATSCSEDEPEKEIDIEQLEKDIMSGKVKFTTNLTSTDSKIELKASAKSYMTMTVTSLFKNKECTSYKRVIEYARKEFADMEEEDFKKEVKELEESIKQMEDVYGSWGQQYLEEQYKDLENLKKSFSRKGNTITYDETYDYAGTSYSEILMEMQMMKAIIENPNLAGDLK